MFSTVSIRAPVNARPACTPFQPSIRAPKRASLQIVAIGEINDPEKTAKAKEKKHSEGQWAEPHNKNKLEKKPIMRGDPGVASETEGNPLEGVKDAIDGVTEKAKDALDGAKDSAKKD